MTSLSNLQLPVMLLWGDDDAVAPMTIPNSIATIVPKERLTFKTMSKTGQKCWHLLGFNVLFQAISWCLSSQKLGRMRSWITLEEFQIKVTWKWINENCKSNSIKIRTVIRNSSQPRARRCDRCWQHWVPSSCLYIPSGSANRWVNNIGKSSQYKVGTNNERSY